MPYFPTRRIQYIDAHICKNSLYQISNSQQLLSAITGPSVLKWFQYQSNRNVNQLFHVTTLFQVKLEN